MATAKTPAEIQALLADLRSELADREKSLPAHSIRPHQLIEIEELQERIAGLEAELEKT